VPLHRHVLSEIAKGFSSYLIGAHPLAGKVSDSFFADLDNGRIKRIGSEAKAAESHGRQHPQLLTTFQNRFGLCSASRRRSRGLGLTGTAAGTTLALASCRSTIRASIMRRPVWGAICSERRGDCRRSHHAIARAVFHPAFRTFDGPLVLWPGAACVRRDLRHAAVDLR